MIKKLESKYCENESYNERLKSALNTFFIYFRSVLVDSSEFRWYEGSHPLASSNNQGMEAKNIKQSHTFLIWAVLSSFTKLTEDSLKEIAKQRIIERFEIPECQSCDNLN